MLKVKMDNGTIVCPLCKESGGILVKVYVGTVLLDPYIMPDGEIRFVSDTSVLIDCPTKGLECSNCGWSFIGNAERG